MDILAGLGFDGRRPNRIGAQLGVAVVGPAGLLGLIEYWAGIAPVEQRHTERVVRYQEALRAVGSATFFASSLRADPLATAETLLRWRDFALDHGWTGKPGSGSPGRLAALAEVEASLTDLSPCLAERISRVIERIARIPAAIQAIRLVDPTRQWAPPWQRLFRALESAGVVIRVEPDTLMPGALEQTDLGRLQHALLADAEQPGPLSLNGDGTLKPLRCLDPQASAVATVASMASQERGLLICGDDGALFDCAARSRGLPSAGLGEKSRWRPPTQLLPLLLQLQWLPPDAEVLLQYLTLPAGPYRILRGRIATRFLDQPGYDPDAWAELIDGEVQARMAKDPNTNEATLRKSIAEWLPVGAARDRNAMPVDLAIAACERVRDYWNRRSAAADSASSSEQTQWPSAARGADSVANALRAWGADAIPREQLRRLLDIAAAETAADSGQTQRLGALSMIASPETARLSADPPAHLVWWEPEVGAETRPPFDPVELAALPDFPDAQGREALRQAAFGRALWPIIATTDSLTLLARGSSDDLLRLRLERLLPFDRWVSFEERLMIAENDQDQHAQGLMGCADLSLIDDLSLPPSQRWWTLNQAIACPRAKESYSGLSSLALEPHAYVLKYVARLSEGGIAPVPLDARLKGNLAHRVVQAWFTENPWRGTAPSSKALSAWLDRRLDDLIMTSGLPLAGAGQRTERLRFRAQVQEALERLLNHLEQAEVREVCVEASLERPAPEIAGGETELEGRLDLLLRLRDADDGTARWAIVDLKWGGQRDREAEFKHGTYLQLATYAALVSTLGDGRLSAFGFFILKSATLLAPSGAIFPGAKVIAAEDPSITPQRIWDRLMATVHWRREQLAQGRIEITSATASFDTESAPPAGGLPVLEIEAERRDSGSRGGWSPKKTGFKTVDPWRVLIGGLRD
ncbi:PD-(D/E)XK nuclease family protein [Thiorhodococcus minor]|uniref:PD-(D/E)XK nuclease family protein n=1 Tax=Thiorhodococcus minor TaxID=57489 RepID=A0A6M0JT17_9GAMM|nr:PD-(D/E)XK nuclease family protein [Thiorhodococcus minor]NEV60379.1 PD-(D/E)XK nuclease family protein [Thiorhodococcus minor]